MNDTKLIKVWDPLIRIFHWSLVISFFTAYITEEDFLGLHLWAGYAVLGLVIFRVIWGVIGSQHARFSDFVYRPAVIKAYLKDILWFKPKHYLGHNPAGGAMVIALLISLLITSITGIAIYGGEESAGPMAGMMAGISENAVDAIEETHEFFANFTLLLVGLHILGVLVASLQHGENLVRAMINGYKQAHSK